MSELPASWKKILLGEEITCTKGKKPKNLFTNYSSDVIPYIDIKAFEKNEVRQYARAIEGNIASSNDSLMVWDGARSGLVGNGISGVIGSTLMKVVPISSEKRYLHYFLISKFQVINGNTKGTGIPHVNPAYLRELSFPVAPIPEQKRIADKLDTVLARVDACRERLNRAPLILKRFKQSVLAAATSGKLTEDWRNAKGDLIGNAQIEVDQKENLRSGKLRVRGQSTKVEADFLFDIPASWAWISNHRLAEDSSTSICAGPFGTIFKAKDFREKGVPIIFLRHVGEGEYLTRKPGFMDEKIWRENHQPYSVYGGELLVTKLGDPPGTTCIYPKNIGVAMVTPDVMKMSVDCDVAHPVFLMHFFNSPLSKKIVQELAFGVTRLRIDLSMFKTFPIPLPPIEEQHEIVRRVETLFAFADRLEARLTTARNATERLTPALLAKAFRGELVSQDPDDEPASELLARISAMPATKTKKTNVIANKKSPKIKIIKEKKNMVKSRQDVEVKHQPYLAEQLRQLGGTANVEALFNAADLPVTDFYKQLAWEVKNGHIHDAKSVLEAT